MSCLLFWNHMTVKSVFPLVTSNFVLVKCPGYLYAYLNSIIESRIDYLWEGKLVGYWSFYQHLLLLGSYSINFCYSLQFLFSMSLNLYSLNTCLLLPLFPWLKFCVYLNTIVEWDLKNLRGFVNRVNKETVKCFAFRYTLHNFFIWYLK